MPQFAAIVLAIASAICIGCGSAPRARLPIADRADHPRPAERTGLVLDERTVDPEAAHAPPPFVRQVSATATDVGRSDDTNSQSVPQQDEIHRLDAGSVEQSNASTQAVTEPGLTLQDLQALALTENPTLAHARARINAARGQQLQAGLYPNPVAGYHGVNIGARGTAGRQAGFIQQRFVTGGKLELDEQVAGHEIRDQQSQLTATRQRVLTDVRSRFYDVLIAQRRKALTQQLANIATELASSTRKLLDAAQTSENTLLQAEIESEQAAIALDNASNELRERWRQLAAVVGQPEMQLTQLEGDFEAIESDRGFDADAPQISGSHPLLAAARARIDRARATITRAEREVIPDITLLADAARTNQLASNTAQARLSVEVPLWDRNEGNIAAAESELAAARAEYRRIELQLQQRLATVCRQYSNARHQASRYREVILPRAERSLELVRDGYENGQIEYLTLLNSQQKFVEVSLAYAGSLEALQRATALLEGQLLTDSLAAD